MLQTILSSNSELTLVDEIQFRSPPWIHRDLVSDIETHVGPLHKDGALDRLVELLYSGIPIGYFWSSADRLLDRDMLYEELSRHPLSTRSIFDAILVVRARMKGKSRAGAKFPVHYSFTPQLLEWYPDCKLIHTTRNPKAVYASQAAKYSRPEQNWVARAIMRFKQFVHINIQISWTARLHRRLRDLPNYRLVRYEELVLEPETQIRQLCDYLEIDFEPEMLKPRQFGSSFKDIGNNNRGIERSSLEKWRSAIPGFTAKLIDLLHYRAYRYLGYGND